MRGPRVYIRGVAIDVETGESTVARVMDGLERGEGGLIVTVNLDHVRRCEHDERYRGLVGRAEIVVADGMPLVWASRVQGTSLPERVAGSDLVWSLCEAASARRRSVFLLGGDPGTAEEAAMVLEKKYPGLRVCGVMAPERGFEHDPVQMDEIEAALVEALPDVVFVALGSPKQEYLAERLRDAVPRAWFIGCGISLSFVAGRVKRAPRWVQRVGLEWLHRLMQEPSRLARRYLADGLPYAAVLIAGAARERIMGSGELRAAERAAPAATSPARRHVSSAAAVRGEASPTFRGGVAEEKRGAERV